MPDQITELLSRLAPSVDEAKARGVLLEHERRMRTRRRRLAVAAALTIIGTATGALLMIDTDNRSDTLVERASTGQPTTATPPGTTAQPTTASSPPTATGNIPVPVGSDGPLVVGEPTATMPTALVRGVVVLTDGCLRLSSSDTGSQLIVWPAGSHWDDTEVVLPDGQRVPPGASIEGAGGYYSVASAAALMPTIADALQACLPPDASATDADQVVITDPHLIEAPPATTTPALETLARPVLADESCVPTYAREVEINGSTRLFGRWVSDSVPVQVIGTTDGVIGSYAVILRYEAVDARPPTFGDAVDINGHDARVYVGADGHGQISWIEPDGSEAYVRSRGTDADTLVAFARALTPRPPESGALGFDVTGPLPEGVALLTETIEPILGRSAMSACNLDGGAEVRVGVIDADAATQYALGVDFSPLPALARRGSQLVWAIAPPTADSVSVLDNITDAPADVWNELLRSSAQATGVAGHVDATAAITVELRPVDPGTAAAASTSTLQIVRDDGVPFLEADMTDAVPPDGAEFWEIYVDGSLRSRTTARQGGVLGVRLTDEQAERGIGVTVLATTAAGVMLASSATQ